MADPTPSRASPEPILRLSKSWIRAYCQDDAGTISENADNWKIARWMRNTFPHPYTVESSLDWISRCASASPTTHFAICDSSSNTVMGGIGVQLKDDVASITAEIGYWLGEPHWGQGIATEALVEFTKWTFANFNELIRLEALVYEGHGASCRVLEKAGYAFEGRMRKAIKKNGEVLDVLIYCTFRPGSGY